MRCIECTKQKGYVCRENPSMSTLAQKYSTPNPPPTCFLHHFAISSLLLFGIEWKMNRQPGMWHIFKSNTNLHFPSPSFRGYGKRERFFHWVDVKQRTSGRDEVKNANQRFSLLHTCRIQLLNRFNPISLILVMSLLRNVCQFNFKAASIQLFLMYDTISLNVCLIRDHLREK